jgi:hypothetical protein
MSSLERPVCPGCAIEMSCQKNSYVVVNKIGNLSWDCDLYRCSGCGNEVVSGSGDSYKPTGRVPDLSLNE